MHESSPETIDRELYERRSVLKLLAMRRTLFLVPIPDVPVVYAAASRAIAEVERKRTMAMFADRLGTDVAPVFDELEAIGLEAVRERGEATTAELTKLDPRLSQRITFAVGKSYQGSISVSQKVFFHLSMDGHIGRGRPRGSWVGNQVRWSPIERWLPDGIAAMSVDEARAELVRRWLRTFGPGTRDDIRWWTGWTVAAVRQALGTIGATEVDLDDGATGYVLPDDLDTVAPPDPWVALLPALDATTMGWIGRDWYMGPHRPRLFDSNGNGGPMVWLDGRVVGGWAQRKTGEVVTYLLEDVGSASRRAIEAEAARLEAWIGPARVSSSFPNPLEVELKR
jgi:hypothetical protein